MNQIPIREAGLAYDFSSDAATYEARRRGVRFAFAAAGVVFAVGAAFYYLEIFPASPFFSGIIVVPAILGYMVAFTFRSDPQLTYAAVDSAGLHLRYSTGVGDDLPWSPDRFGATFVDPRGFGGPEHRGPNPVSMMTHHGTAGWVPEALVAAVVDGAGAHGVPVRVAVEGDLGYKAYHRAKVTRVGILEKTPGWHEGGKQG